ncbi:hypothetical protein NRIC_07650 [Enterococcus florum]|uniref:Uncharacterized protein n=1 Tax=Enterococcus florum TaxID=2480627 RepID=A0A4P5P992_9ENTE|nr:hypothetical protein [Enterococcus florum]GCF92874.1 hypothetical protein NRIC_07650 [Enterococcus florum]
MLTENKQPTSFLFVHWKAITVIITTVILIILSITIIWTNLLHPVSAVQVLEQDWLFSEKNRTDQQLIGSTKKRMATIQAEEPLIMQKNLTTASEITTLALRTNHQWISVFVDNQLIYEYQPTAKEQRPGFLFTSVKLPSHFNDNTLRIVTTSPYSFYSGIPAQVFIGSQEAIQRFLRIHTLPQRVLLLLSICFSGVILICLKRRQTSSKRRKVMSGSLIAFIFSIGIHALSSTPPSMMAHVNPELPSTLYNLSLLLIPTFLTSYYLLRTKRYFRWYFPMMLIGYLIVLINLACVVFMRTPIPAVLNLAVGFHVFNTLYTALISLLEASDENHFFIICSPGIITAAIIHCFFYIQLFIGAANLTIDWPMIVFTCLAIVLFSYHYWEDCTYIRTHKRLIEIKKEPEAIAAGYQELLDNRNYSVSEILEELHHDYQKKFEALTVPFTYQLQLEESSKALEEEQLLLLVHLLEKLWQLSKQMPFPVHVVIRQRNGEWTIESHSAHYEKDLLDHPVESDVRLYFHHLTTLIQKRCGHYEQLEDCLIIRI